MKNKKSTYILLVTGAALAILSVCLGMGSGYEMGIPVNVISEELPGLELFNLNKVFSLLFAK
ncbi:MAG: hypothetical protein OEW75_01415 [Cyclobacteriaceae bacterium]|nr:hypothetical protein [Cyclobacteriaceae bacterium]